ncbi:methionine ABC transporter permease [Sporolactobacillus terrae]|uniref:ABC transporter permease n=1 Tax=Sporolactobacillus terrae TaxID=269673 RepID=A0A410D7J3_9BACL|nr:methionine ABC transporter permease [Sporolactobacillus terrae]QAA22085.1 methionine ABC transporter permease [Sporolactobacillus terrae]QAA25057.1 methionine ABC transporter permease [Sporolactobacillus terrae]UAK16880.1 ABC transporter permease [Sporolactobacillus terrae]BBN98377.1 ABC transporter permease [Sporolactobacillus terrae]
MSEWLQAVDWPGMWLATGQTLYMTIISGVFTLILGILLGLLLYLTAKGGLFENQVVYGLIASFVNTFRSIPFIILIILLIPFTMLLLGTMIGATAALPAIIIGSAPFYGRLVEIGLREVDKGVIEAAQAMGATRWQIVLKVLLPEAMPALSSGMTVTFIALIGNTAMAGVIGAGGLGTIAYNEGFQTNNNLITFIATLIILVIVFLIQYIGDRITRRVDKR